MSYSGFIPPVTNTFGEQITLPKETLFDLKSIYGYTRKRDRKEVVGSGDVTNNGNGEYVVTTTADGGDSTLFRSAERGRYVAGKDAQAGIEVRTTQQPTGNQYIEWGYFADASNQLAFGYDSQGYYVVRRSGASENIIRQADWNLDTADGNGPSGFNLDTDEGYIYQIDFSWYGAGPVIFSIAGVDPLTGVERSLKVHALKVSGELSIQDPNLPVSLRIVNDGTATANTVYVAGRQFSVIGSYNPKRRITAEYRSSTSVGTTLTPLVTFQRKAGFESVSVKVQSVKMEGSGDLIYEVVANGTLTGASFATPTGYDASETALEVDTSASAITGGDPVDKDVVFATGQGSNSEGLSNEPLIGFDFIKKEPVTLCARTISGTETVKSLFKVVEEW